MGGETHELGEVLYKFKEVTPGTPSLGLGACLLQADTSSVRGHWGRDLPSMFKFSCMQMKAFCFHLLFGSALLWAMLTVHLNECSFSVLDCCYGNAGVGNILKRGHVLNLRYKWGLNWKRCALLKCYFQDTVMEQRFLKSLLLEVHLIQAHVLFSIVSTLLSTAPSSLQFIPALLSVSAFKCNLSVCKCL